jgi:hypothetical protein
MALPRRDLWEIHKSPKFSAAENAPVAKERPAGASNPILIVHPQRRPSTKSRQDEMRPSHVLIQPIEQRQMTQLADKPDSVQIQPPAPERKKSTNGNSPYFLALVVIGGAYWWYDSRPHFGTAEVTATKANIKKLYEEKGFTVQDVDLVIESDRKLSGFVKITKPPLITEPIMKDCSATLGNDGNYIWRCQ